MEGEDFPGGPMVKNRPANAGDTGLNRGPGRFCTLQSKKAHAPQLLSLSSRAGALQQEKTPQWEARTPQREKPPLARARESLCRATKTAQPKINKLINLRGKKKGRRKKGDLYLVLSFKAPLYLYQVSMFIF